MLRWQIIVDLVSTVKSLPLNDLDKSNTPAEKTGEQSGRSPIVGQGRGGRGERGVSHSRHLNDGIHLRDLMAMTATQFDHNVVTTEAMSPTQLLLNWLNMHLFKYHVHEVREGSAKAARIRVTRTTRGMSPASPASPARPASLPASPTELHAGGFQPVSMLGADLCHGGRYVVLALQLLRLHAGDDLDPPQASALRAALELSRGAGDGIAASQERMRCVLQALRELGLPKNIAQQSFDPVMMTSHHPGTWRRVLLLLLVRYFTSLGRGKEEGRRR